MHTPRDPSSILQLIDLLNQERSIYEETAGLLGQEREALTGLAMDRLAEIVSRKETLALRVKALDESRRVLARRLGQNLGLNADAVTITGLCELLPPAEAIRLRQAGEALKAVVMACRESNQLNEHAARHGRELIQCAIDEMVRQADPTGKVYEAPARKAMRRAYAPAPGFISRQV